MKTVKHNKAIGPIRKFMDANPECTINNIVVNTGIPQRTVERNVGILVETGEAYISGYLRPIGSGKVARQFTLGRGKSIVLKKASDYHKNQVKTEWQRRTRATKKVLAKAKEGGIFGILMAQISS